MKDETKPELEINSTYSDQIRKRTNMKGKCEYSTSKPIVDRRSKSSGYKPYSPKVR